MKKEKIVFLIIIMMSCICCRFASSPVMAKEEEADIVSTGDELKEWLMSHRDTGGSAKLSCDVTLDGDYSYSPSRTGMPPVFVDAGRYSVTVSGEAEFFSDGQLFFIGRKEGGGVFRVAKGGLLSLSGVTVEGVTGALWQEEGAGLVVDDNCRVSGEIHYADTPFVIRQQSACVIVKEGQTASLPAELTCTVNREGQASYHEKVPVSWNLEGTENWQNERLRFSAQGSFPYAASKEPPSCTVVYDDYPLTFTEVKASASETLVLFRGSYTKPEDSLPITVMTEYSFDGTCWRVFEEKSVSNALDGFFIGVESGEWDTKKDPYLYIRLQWNDNGNPRYSNVLRYAADNLDHAVDQGGDRGGATSITRPPEQPQQQPDGAPENASRKPSDQPEHKSFQNGAEETEPEKGAAGAGKAKSPGKKRSGADTGGSGKKAASDTENSGGKVTPDAGSSGKKADSGAGNPGGKVTPDAENPGSGRGSRAGGNFATASFGVLATVAEDADESSFSAEASAREENGASSFQMREIPAGKNVRHGRNLALAAGFSALSVLLGAACFAFRDYLQYSIKRLKNILFWFRK